MNDWCIAMKDGKRINRVAISVDDELLLMLTHLANFDNRTLADYCHKILQESVFGSQIKLPHQRIEENRND